MNKNGSHQPLDDAALKSARMNFLSQRPDQSPSEVWQLQNELLAKAERLLGPKSKKIYQPTFSGNGPYIINTPSEDGAFAELSMTAAGHWPTALFELAHETIHLLDPVVGNTNYLEEGVAVVFAVESSRSMTNHPMEPTDFPIYMEAWQLVREAFEDVFASAKAIRLRYGSLRKATLEDLVELFPDADSGLLQKLVSQCIPR